MANYQLLKADIDEKVYQNGHQEITGENLNSVLNAMVTTLGAEYQFAGVATKDTNPGTPDAKVFYIANGKGTYTNFGGINVTEDEVVVLYWDSSWHKEATGIASNEKLTELDEEVNGKSSKIQVPFDNVGRYSLQRVPGDETMAFPLLQDVTNCNCVSFEVKSGDIVHIVATPQKSTTYAWTYTTPISASGSVVVKKVPTLGVAVDEYVEIDADGLMYVVAKNTLPYSATIIRKVGNGIIERIDNIERWGDIEGKKVLWTGDSICAANELVNIGVEDGGWADRIAEKYGIVSSNKAMGGSVITENLYNTSGNLCRSILTKYNVILNNMPDADYIIFDIGTNDADVIGYIVEADADGNYVPKANKPTAFGAWNSHDYSGAYDTNTYCGAFEAFIYRTLTTLPEKKLGYIVAPKQIKVGYDIRFQNRKAYYDEAVKICRKWGVPVLNLWEENTLNPYIPNQYNSALSPLENENGGYLYIDGQHPSSHGYDKIYDVIARWIKTL